MCGRFVATATSGELADYFQAVLSETVAQALSASDDSAPDAAGAGPAAKSKTAIGPNYNVAPTTMIHTIRADHGHRQVELMRWGLVPSWAKDVKVGSRMINARSETAAEKPAFRSAIKKRRCLIPAEGFYEWQKLEGQKTKQPYFIDRVDDEPVVFAGLWEAWKPKEDHEGSHTSDSADWLVSCTILTTSPNAEMAAIHNRMPVLVPPSWWERWLDPQVEVATVSELFAPAPDGLLNLTPISTQVNSVGNKGPELLVPLDRSDDADHEDPGQAIGQTSLLESS